MKKLGRLVLTTLLLISVLAACSKESLVPAFRTATVNELKNNQPIFFSYQIDDTQIDEYAKNASNFPIFGRLFQAIAVVLANTTISNEGGHELELSSVDVDLSLLNEIDFDLINYISLDNLLVNIRNPKSKDTLQFIEKLEIYARFDHPIQGLPVDSEGLTRLLFYNKEVDHLGCEGKCIKLNISALNWKEILKENKMVQVRPKLTINSVPTSTMKLAGSIDFSVKFELGF